MPAGGAFRGGAKASPVRHVAPSAAPLKKLDEAEYEKCANDLPYFLENWCLVKAKESQDGEKTKMVPFKLNAGQRILHEKAEQQLAETGMVRICVPKGRQLGVSTYISARMMHQCIFSKESIDAAFMSHDKKSLDKLRRQRFVSFMDNLRGNKFPKMGGSQGTKTIRNSTIEMTYASGAEPLRGSSIDFLHLSEVASFDLLVADGGAMVAAAAMSAVSDTKGTEVWMESTPRGPSGSFYRWCSDAEAGENEFEVVFLKTSLDPTYEIHPLPQGFKMNKQEEIYAKTHGLNEYHMAWRRRKRRKLGEAKFKEEFPETLEECWEMGDTGSYLDPSLVARACRAMKPSTHLAKLEAPVILGVDVGEVRDPTVVCVRQAHRVLRFYEVIPSTFDRQAAQIARIADECNAQFVMVDAGGIGTAVLQILAGLIGSKAIGIQPGGKPDNTDLYHNRRAELWGRTAAWLATEDPEAVIYAQDQKTKDKLVEELLAHEGEHDEFTRLKISRKVSIRSKLGRSPDYADALTLTFGFDTPVLMKDDGTNPMPLFGTHQAVRPFQFSTKWSM